MDKVWFKLRQTHYPPGPEEAILTGAGDDAAAPICLGHCFADPRRLDFPLNRGAIVPFPPRMRVFRASTVDFAWDGAPATELDLGLAAGSPIAAALGLLTVKAGLKMAFRTTVGSHEAYGAMDTYTMQPTRRYVEACLDTEALGDHVGDRRRWSLFMVTGIRVARAGSRTMNKTRAIAVGGGPEVGTNPLVSVEATGTVVVDNVQGSTEGSMSDFVWAVRLAKVHKGMLMTDWSLETYTEKATFSKGQAEEVDLAAVLSREHLAPCTVIDDDELGEAVVVDAEDWEMLRAE